MTLKNIKLIYVLMKFTNYYNIILLYMEDTLVFVVLNENKQIVQMDFIADECVYYTNVMSLKEYNNLFQKQMMTQDYNNLENDDDINEMDHN